MVNLPKEFSSLFVLLSNTDNGAAQECAVAERILCGLRFNVRILRVTPGLERG